MSAQNERKELTIRHITAQMEASTLPPSRRGEGSGVRRMPDSHDYPTIPAPTPAIPTGKALRRLGREGGDLCVEVELMGHWVVGRAARVMPDGLVVRGVHPFHPEQGHECRVRVVRTNADGEVHRVSAQARWESYDAATGEVVLTYANLSIGRLVSACVQDALKRHLLR